MTTQPPIYLTVAEAAERMRVSPRFIRRLIDNGTLPVHRFGGAIRIKRTTLDDVASSAQDTPLQGRGQAGRRHG